MERDWKKLTRRRFLSMALLSGAGLGLASCAPQPAQPTTAPTKAPEPTKPAATTAPAPTAAQPTKPAATAATAAPAVKPLKAGLAPGMIGGPTGFPGAERFQYPEDSAEGRAVLAARKLKAEGKAPEKLVVMLWDGAIGHWNKPFPEGAPTAQQVWEEETGIKLEFIGVPPAESFQKAIQDVTTKAGQFDLYTFGFQEMGDLVEAGALLKLDEFVEKHKPEWTDPKVGYVGGATTVELFNKYAGSYYAVSFDGDWQIWIYRKDLFEDPKEQRAFRERYGWDLQWPETWEQLDQIAEFFHRPDQGLVGVTDLRNPFWGFTNWIQRYVSFADPNQMYFDENTAKPLIDSEAGIKATEEYVNATKWHSPDFLTWGWPEQYPHFAEGGAAITCAFPNMPKFLDNPNGPWGGKMVGKLASGISPGRIINGKLIRRSVVWPNNQNGVSALSKYPEVAYLLLQWGGGGRIFSWMVGNPAGYYDPFQETDLRDPLVTESYKPYQIATIRETIKRTVPPITLAGQNEYVNVALDQNLQAALTKQKSPEQAMKDVAAAWEQITDKIGREKQIAALKAQKKAWPTVVDTPKIKVG